MRITSTYENTIYLLAEPITTSTVVPSTDKSPAMYYLASSITTGTESMSLKQWHLDLCIPYKNTYWLT